MRDGFEAVSTKDLREGDVLYSNGCLMQCVPFKEAYDRINQGKFGPVRWCTARVLKRFDDTIPSSWFGVDHDGTATWQIQGNDLAIWTRQKNPF